jgi:hypothetical protein
MLQDVIDELNSGKSVEEVRNAQIDKANGVKPKPAAKAKAKPAAKGKKAAPKKKAAKKVETLVEADPPADAEVNTDENEAAKVEEKPSMSESAEDKKADEIM